MIPCILLLQILSADVANALEKVVLQLAWKHQFQFAGYYAALHKGYYREAGLNVAIVEGGEGRFAAEEVFRGHAQYGVAGAELLLHRAEGDPVVVLAAIFQHTASIILTRGDSGIVHPQDLIGRRLMLLSEHKDADILGIFQREGIPLNLIHLMAHSYDVKDLIEGRTDAVSAYITNEPWLVMQSGITPGIIFPQTYGVDFYSDCLFTTEQEIETVPHRVQKFLAASLRGWDYAMAHQEEIVDLLIDSYKVRKNHEHLRYEAHTMETLIFPKLVEIGHMNPGRWRHIADTFALLGVLPENFSLEGFIYEPDPKVNIKKLEFVLFMVLAGFVGTSLLILFFVNMNRKLRNEVLERQRTEKFLRESESQKEAILNGITANIVYIDKDMKILWSNKTAADSVGRKPAALIGRRCYEFWGYPEKPCKVCPTIKALKSGKSEQAVMHAPDGRIWDERGEPVFDSEGQLQGVVKIAQDITDSKLAEEKLHESETRLRVIFDTSLAAIMLVSPRGLVTFANRGMAEMFGCTQQELIGIAYPALVHPDQRAGVNSKLRHFISGEIDSISWERHFIRFDGTDFWGFVSGRRHVDEQGKLISLITIITDMTERKKLENELRQAQKMESIGTLTGGVAHDFNNILTAILGNTELALEYIPQDNRAYANLQAIRSAGLRAAGIIKQLLNFSRKTDLVLRPIEVIAVIRDALEFLRSTIPATIEIRKYLPDTEVIIYADSIQISQALFNLCANAAHAMEETGGILTISVEIMILKADTVQAYPGLTVGTYLKITVSDTGSGIDPKIIDRIFDPYFTTKAFGKGSGMGLAVVHGIVKNHSGAITVDSRPGKGATFTICFPIVTETPMIETEDRDEIPLGNERILFVDDEEFIRDMVDNMLTHLGYRVVIRQTPEDALKFFRAEPYLFDLVITDMGMPRMSGITLFEKIREVRKNIPVIICTGHSPLIDKEKAGELGINALVMKPIVKQTIAVTIRRVLDNSRMRS